MICSTRKREAVSPRFDTEFSNQERSDSQFLKRWRQLKMLFRNTAAIDISLETCAWLGKHNNMSRLRQSQSGSFAPK